MAWPEAYLRLKSSDAFYRSYRLQMRTVFTREAKNKARKTRALILVYSYWVIIFIITNRIFAVPAGIKYFQFVDRW